MKHYFFALAVLLTSPSFQAATYNYTLNADSSQLRVAPVPDALFGANSGYWSDLSRPSLVADAQAAGLTVLRYHPGTYNDPETVPGSINMWDFTAVDATGAARLGDFGRFLIATGATGQIHINYGAGSPAQAAALVAYLRVRTDAPTALLNLSLGSSVVEPTLTGTRTRDWRTVGFWANLRASAPLAIDDGFNKLRLNHPEPFPVKYWECGNEADYKFVPCMRYKVPGETSITQGATGYGGRRADAFNYANFYAAAKALMQQVDPTIQVGASAGYFEQAYNDTDSPAVPFLFPGTSGATKAWTPVMLTRLKALGVVPDFIIAHRYTRQTDFSWNNDYLLRGALRAYLANPAQGDLPRIHVTELNWSDDEFTPYTTTINNAVNLAASFGDALQNDVNNLCWFTFTSGSANHNPASTTGWRRYHNWGIIGDQPTGPSANFPGNFTGVRFPVFHAFALLKAFTRPGDRIYAASALSPVNTNSAAVPVFASRRANGDLTLLVLNRESSTHTLSLTLASAGTLNSTIQGLHYGQAQDEEQRLKALDTPPVATNNTAQAFTESLSGNLLNYDAPPFSVSVLTLSNGTGLQAFRSTNGLATNGSQDLLIPAGDGTTNLLKYAFNMIGNGTGQGSNLNAANSSVITANGTAGLPLVDLDAGKLRVTFVRRISTSNPGVGYAVEFSDTLANGTWAVNASATTVVTNIDATFERVVVTDNATSANRRFVRTRVTVL